MIFWRGKGWWTLVVLWGSLYLLPGLLRMRQGMSWAQATRPQLYGPPFIAGLLVAGVILVGWGAFLNRRPARKAIQAETGRTYMAKPGHSLYRLNMEYWGLAALLGGILMWIKSR